MRGTVPGGNVGLTAASRGGTLPSVTLLRGALGLARSCHPGPTVAVTAVAAVLCAAVGHDAASGTAVTSAVLAGQLSIGWGNDWLDRDRDRRTGRADKPLAAGSMPGTTVLAAARLAAVACVPLSLLTGPGPGLLHLLAVASGWSYNLGLKTTAASPLPFAVSFGLLPAYVVAAAPGPGGAPGWMIVAGALLGTGAHFANVLPDLDDDLVTGVRGLGHRIGGPACAVVAATMLAAAVTVLAFGPAGTPTAGGWLALAVTVPVGAAGLARGRRPGSRAPFTAVLVLAVVAVGLLLLAGGDLR